MVGHAQEAGHRFYYRRAIPKDLRGFFGGKWEVVVSLKTQEEGVARARVLEVALETERAIQRARDQVRQLSVDPDALAKRWRADILREDQQDRIDRSRDLDPESASPDSLDTEIEALTEAVRENHEALVAGDLQPKGVALRLSRTAVAGVRLRLPSESARKASSPEYLLTPA